MLMTDYSSKLLNLEDVIITGVENIADQLHIYLELPRSAHICPACGATTDRIQDYRMRRSRMCLWPEIPSCTYVIAVIAVLR